MCRDPNPAEPMTRFKPLGRQTVVVTGASSGIGWCTARHLAAHGAAVVATARNADSLALLVAEIEAAGGRAVAIPGDVTSETDLRRVARTAVERFGGLDTWINNAAIFMQAPVMDTELDEFRRVVDVNLVGYVNGTRCALERMLPAGRGGIIQVSSMIARRGAAWCSAYAASKFAIDGFTQSLRTELWGTGIRVSTIYLPAVDTPVYRHARGKFGTVPKPPPPVTDPAVVARAIARLAERPATERSVGAFAQLYMRLPLLPAAVGDWFLQHTADFTRSTLPAAADNLDGPLRDSPRVRDGWSRPGWRGLTLGETARVLPWETAMVGAAAALALVRAARRRPRSRSRTRRRT
jgi:NAD(P)-dependent dehydrogenase (short-subunit alcohol dehydrogenase family)